MTEHPSLVKPRNTVDPTMEIVSEMKDSKTQIDELRTRVSSLTESAKDLNQAIRETVQHMDVLDDLIKQALTLLIKRLENFG